MPLFFISVRKIHLRRSKSNKIPLSYCRTLFFFLSSLDTLFSMSFPSTLFFIMSSPGLPRGSTLQSTKPFTSPPEQRDLCSTMVPIERRRSHRSSPGFFFMSSPGLTRGSTLQSTKPFTSPPEQRDLCSTILPDLIRQSKSIIKPIYLSGFSGQARE